MSHLRSKMKQLYLQRWLLATGVAAVAGACSSDRAALAARTTGLPAAVETRPALPSSRDASSAARSPVSAYASVPLESPTPNVAKPAAPARTSPVTTPARPVPARNKAAYGAHKPAAPRLTSAVAVAPKASGKAKPPSVIRRATAPAASPSVVAGRAATAPRVAVRPSRPAAPAGAVAAAVTPAHPTSAAPPIAKPVLRPQAPPQAGALPPVPRPSTVPSKPLLMLRPDTALALRTRPLEQLAPAVAVPTQEFALNPRRDTVVRAASGTLIRVAAGAFALASDTAAALLQPITLRLREYVALPDLILAGLTTRAADGKLLESGGAVWFDATTVAGRPCVLRAGRDLHLAVPVRGGRRAAMRVFTPDSLNTARMDGVRWQPVGSRDPTEVVRAMPPQYGPGLSQLEASLRNRMGFLPSLAAQLLERMPVTDRRVLRKEWSESGKVLQYTKTLKQGIDMLSVFFDVDENGTASNWSAATGYHSILVNAFQAIAPQLPGPWRAGTCAGRAAPMRARLLMLCYDDGTSDVEIRSHPDDWAPCEGPARAQFVTDYEMPAGRYGADGEYSAAAARRRAPSGDLLGSRYLLDAPRLGWLNCNRFTEMKGPVVTYSLDAGAPSADVRLVFRRSRVVLAGASRGTQVEFTGVPAHEPVTVVAVRTDPQGQAWLALQPAVIGEPLPAALAYRPVSVTELRAALAELEPQE